jgi:ubiquitin carboxyl-terminal hydrolase 10
MFQREFKVIASAGNAELLRKKLKIDELEHYGEQFSPDFIYEAIRKLPRFASMRVCSNLLVRAFSLYMANV